MCIFCLNDCTSVLMYWLYTCFMCVGLCMYFLPATDSKGGILFQHFILVCFFVCLHLFSLLVDKDDEICVCGVCACMHEIYVCGVCACRGGGGGGGGECVEWFWFWHNVCILCVTDEFFHDVMYITIIIHDCSACSACCTKHIGLTYSRRWGAKYKYSLLLYV